MSSGARVTKPPHWEDLPSVTTFVEEILDSEFPEEEQRYDLWDGVSVSRDMAAGVEQYAIDAAERGEFETLSDLIRPTHPMNNCSGETLRSQLSPSTWDLIADIIIGKKKRKRGRP